MIQTLRNIFRRPPDFTNDELLLIAETLTESVRQIREDLEAEKQGEKLTPRQEDIMRKVIRMSHIMIKIQQRLS